MEPRFRITWGIVAALTFAGCNGGGTTDGGADGSDTVVSDGTETSTDASDAAHGNDGSDANPADAPASTVTVTYVNDFLSDTGDMPAPQTPNTPPMGAIVRTGTTFRAIAASNIMAGGFTIDSVPAGAYYLQLGSDFIVTSARTVDIGNDVYGRPNVATAHGSSTALTLNVSGLDAWANGDDLELLSANAGFFYDGLQLTGTPALATGATSTGGLTVNWFAQNLIDGTHGDVTYVSQLVTHTGPGSTTYLTLKKTLQAPSTFSITDGPTTTLTGVATVPSVMGSTPIDWRRSMFDSLHTAVNSAASIVSLEGGIAAEPAGLMHGPLRPYGHVVSLPRTTDVTDANLGMVSYQNPYPSTWPLFGFALETFAVLYQLPGGSRTVQAATIVTYADATSFGGGPVQPAISPVQAIQVGGMSVVGGTHVTGVGESPVVSWMPPATGTATRYVVGVVEIYVNVGRTTLSTAGAILTTETSVAIPPGLMQTGHTYVLLVRAVSLPNSDAQQHPFRDSFPHAEADAYTDPFAP